MIDANEQILIVDENNKPVGHKSRKEAHAKGLWHRTSHVWIVNDAGEILSQKRSLKKDSKPGLWEPYLGGHNGSDDYVGEGIKEVSEEIGITFQPEDFKQFTIVKLEDTKHFSAVLVVRWNGDLKELKLEEDEVSDVAWQDAETLRYKMIEDRDEDWSPYKGYEDKLLDSLAK